MILTVDLIAIYLQRWISAILARSSAIFGLSNCGPKKTVKRLYQKFKVELSILLYTFPSALFSYSILLYVITYPSYGGEGKFRYNS